MLSATPNARPVIGLVADPSSRSSRSDTAAQPTGAADQDAGMMPSPSCSLCKPSLPLGAMHCRIISATPPPPTLYRPSPISISTSWPQLCRHAATDETDSPAASDNHQRQSAPHNPLANVNQKRQSCSPSVVADSIQIDALPTLIVALHPPDPLLDLRPVHVRQSAPAPVAVHPLEQPVQAEAEPVGKRRIGG